MKRVLASLVALSVATLAGAPATAQPEPRVSYALEGEARALEAGVAGQGITAGLALVRGDSEPSASAAGAGQCSLLGEDPDPDSLPCNEATTQRASAPGGPSGEKAAACAENLDALAPALLLRLACGEASASVADGLPSAAAEGRVAGLGTELPVDQILPEDLSPEQLAEQLADALAPLIEQTPEQLRDPLEQILQSLQNLQAPALAAEVGAGRSQVGPRRGLLEVRSDAAGARIGILGVPEDGEVDPLESGLVIIEVGAARASATLDPGAARASADASPAIVTVRVRDVTQPEPTYEEISVAPGQTVTVLEGTPAESTITAADSTVEESGSTARAAADAVRLHLLKGAQGGIELALGRATAAVAGERVLSAPPQEPRRELPVTGGPDLTGPGIALLALALAIALVALRRARA